MNPSLSHSGSECSRGNACGREVICNWTVHGGGNVLDLLILKIKANLAGEASPLWHVHHLHMYGIFHFFITNSSWTISGTNFVAMVLMMAFQPTLSD